LHGDTKKHLKVICDEAEIRTGHQIDAVSEEGAGGNTWALET